jgi:hypothetical protein
MNLSNIKEKLVSDNLEDVILYDTPDYADAFIVVTYGCDSVIAVYDYDKMIKCLIDDGMSESEAVEFIDRLSLI